MKRINSYTWLFLAGILLICLLTTLGFMIRPQNHKIKKIHYHSNTITFDFPEPPIPQMYELAYEHEPGMVDTIRKDFFKYCATVPHLKNLSKNKQIRNGNTLSYAVQSAELNINKNTGEMGFIDVFYSSTPKDKTDSKKAEKFIQQYGGGMRSDLKYEKKEEIGAYFLQYFEGVKVTGFGYEGIYMEMPNGKGLISYGRRLYNYKKLRPIPKQKIIKPLEAIKKIIPYFEEFPPLKVKFYETSLVYLNYWLCMNQLLIL